MTRKRFHYFTMCAVILSSSVLGLAYRHKSYASREAELLEECKNCQRRLQEVLSAYCEMNSPEVMPVKLARLSPLFLKKLPRCPSAPDLDYQYSRMSYRGFIISCPGRHQQIESGYPIALDERRSFDTYQEFKLFYRKFRKDIPPPLPRKDSPESTELDSPFRLNPNYPRQDAVPEFQHLFDDPSLRAPQNVAEPLPAGASAINPRPR
jgi:hypothetical protein